MGDCSEACWARKAQGQKTQAAQGSQDTLLHNGKTWSSSLLGKSLGMQTEIVIPYSLREEFIIFA